MYTAGVSAQYRVVPQVYLTAGYRWVRRDSNEGGDAFFGTDPFDYDRQQVYLTINRAGFVLRIGPGQRGRPCQPGRFTGWQGLVAPARSEDRASRCDSSDRRYGPHHRPFA